MNFLRKIIKKTLDKKVFFWYHKAMTTNKNKNFDLICMAALRYALGRSSYIVGTVQDFLVDNAEEMIDSVPKFMQEISKHLKENPTENEWVRNSWLETNIKLQNKYNGQ